MSIPADNPNDNLDAATSYQDSQTILAATNLARDIVAGLKDKLSDGQESEVLEVVRRVAVRQSASYFKGPQPPPELLAQYEQISPGWAARMLEMGERQQLHRIECEKEALALNRLALEQNRLWIGYSGTGQIMGFIAFLLVAGVGVYAMHLGMEAIAGVCFGTFGIGIVGLFLKGRSHSAGEKKDG
jgi:uncharacterized membrane protein